MKGVLNERTDKIHKLRTGEPDPSPECGATRRVDHDEISVQPVEDAIEKGTDRCGRCFPGEGGY